MSTKKTDIAYLNDFQTPPPVCKYMVSLLPPGVKKVMEPTPGQGNVRRSDPQPMKEAPVSWGFFYSKNILFFILS